MQRFVGLVCYKNCYVLGPSLVSQLNYLIRGDQYIRMSEQSNFGLELLYQAHKNDVANDGDAVVLFIHWVLLQNGFRCCDDSGGGGGSELLPAGWNTAGGDQAACSLHYTLAGRRCKLTVHVVQRRVMADFSNISGESSSFTACLDDIIGSNIQCFSTLYKDTAALKQQVEKSFSLKSPAPAGTSSTRTSTCSEPATANTARHDGVGVGGAGWGGRGLPTVGGSDLDPLGRGGGGGMLMNMPPRHPISALPAWHPAGARFDPMMPGGAGPLGGPPPGSPDADHLPPPGYSDMFM